MIPQAVQLPLCGIRGIVLPAGRQSLGSGLQHYWPLSEGPAIAVAGSTTGHMPDMMRMNSWLLINTNTNVQSFKWDSRFGSVHKWTFSPSNRMTANNSSTENYASWTLAGWANLTSVTVGTIICHGSNADRNRFLGFDNVSGKFFVSFTSAPNTFKSVLAANAALVGKWYHVVGSYDGTTEKIYVNGVLSNSSVFSIAAENVTSLTTIGAIDTLGNSTFDGKIVHVAEWNRALTPEEINLLYRDPWVMYPRKLSIGASWPG